MGKRSSYLELGTNSSSKGGVQIWGRDLATSGIYIFIRRPTNMGEKSSNLEQIHLHKKMNKYGREF